MQNNTRMCGNMTFILSVDQDISGYIVLILNWTCPFFKRRICQEKTGKYEITSKQAFHSSAKVCTGSND